VVIEVVRHDQEFKSSSKGSKKKSSLDYTVHVEWDGGGVEEIRNPDWRMKGDEPDKQGRISHRDNRVCVICRKRNNTSFNVLMTTHISLSCSFDHTSSIGLTDSIP
jgi:hypothetical protein